MLEEASPWGDPQPGFGRAGVGGGCPHSGAVGQPDAATEVKLQVQVLIQPAAQGNHRSPNPGCSHPRGLPRD